MQVCIACAVHPAHFGLSDLHRPVGESEDCFTLQDVGVGIGCMIKFHVKVLTVHSDVDLPFFAVVVTTAKRKYGQSLVGIGRKAHNLPDVRHADFDAGGIFAHGPIDARVHSLAWN